MTTLLKQSANSLLLTVFAALLLAFLVEFHLIEKNFNRFADRSFAQLEQKMRSFDSALEEFASFIQTTPNASDEQLRNHVQTLRQTYTGIYMFEVIKRVAREQRAIFEQSMQARGYQDFAIHGFDYDSSREQTSIGERYAYFPISFVEPENEHSSKVLGLDIGSTSPLLANAMMASIWSETIVASKPFDLLEGGRAYLLFHPIYRGSPWSVNANDQAKLEFALLVIKAENLASEIIKTTDQGYSFKIDHQAPDSDQNNQSLTNIASNILPGAFNSHYKKTASLNSSSQQVKATLAKQLRWHDFNLLRLIAITLGGFLLIWLVSAKLIPSRDNSDAR